MTSETQCSSVMVVPYQWILENIEKDPKILSSKMILFRGEEVFRVALKNIGGPRQTLIFIAMNLNKLGMKVHKVFYSCSNQNLEKSMMPEEKQGEGFSLMEGHDGGTFIQGFSTSLYPPVFGKTTFLFHIQIEGTVAEYFYHLTDRLLKNQLWMAVKKLQLTDIDLIVQGKKMSAHKCILAARSPVFAAEFAKNKTINQIVIDDVDYSTLEQILHFIYTGETNKSLANEQLFKLADRYQLTTLASLCKNALGQIDAEQVMRSLIDLPSHSYYNPTPSFETRPTKDTELYFDPNTSTFLAEADISGYKETIGPVFFEYQNEKLFSVYIKTFGFGSNELRLICTRHRNSGYEIVEAFYSVPNISVQRGVSQWKKMKRKNVQEQGFIYIFLDRWLSEIRYGNTYTIIFRIKIASSIENYRYELMDTTYVTQLWSAATNQHLTDVEISVGSRKFGAHRVVLSARSPVFDAQLNKDSNLDLKSFITVSEAVDPDMFQHFLEFLYTGTLKIPACNPQLLTLAEMYNVETLKLLCQVNRELDADRVTTSILAA